MNKKKLKRIILSLFIFLFVVGINYYLIKDVYLDIFEIFQTLSLLKIMILLLWSLCPLLFQALSLKKLIQIKGVKDSYKDVLSQVFSTVFLSYSLSPAIGKGTQIAMLKKRNISLGNACDIGIADQIVNSIATLFLFSLSIIMGYRSFSKQFPTLWIIAIIGFLTTLLIFVVLLLLYIPLINQYIHTFIEWILKYVNHIKYLKRLCLNLLQIVDEIKESKIDYTIHKKEYIFAIIFCFIKALMYHSIPCIILYLLDAQMKIQELYLYIYLSCFVTMILNAIPIYGDYGIAEISFITIFSHYIDSSLATSAMFLWRFTTFYFISLVGGFVFMKYSDKDVKNYVENESE